jgi:hypothetical protein
MSRLHSTFIALVLAAATATGLFAAVHSVRLGQKVSATHPTSVSARDIASRRAKLARWSRSLHRALAKRPPALPKLPKFAPVQVPQAPTPATAPAAAATPAAPPVTYVRPKPVVTYRHAATPTTSTTTTWSDDGGSDDGGGGGGDGYGSGGGD